MNKTKSVSIIGSGIGGITTAIFLAKEGYKVRVFEKNPNPGGRCGQIIRDGHRFDLGATIYFLPSVYDQVFSKMGLNVKDYFDFIPVKNLYRIFYDDGSHLDFTNSKDELKSQLENLEPGAYERAMLYVDKGYNFLIIGLLKLLDRNFYNPFQFFTINNLIQIVRIKGLLKHSTYIKRFFKHPHLRMAFTFQNIYVGQSPYNSSALFSMLPAAEIQEGSVFPVGGMHRIVEKMIEIAENLGVEFNYDSDVSRIVTDKDRASAIEFNDGSIIQSDLIVANADLPYVYRELLPESRKARRLNNNKEFTCSAIVFHWGLKKPLPNLSQHNVFLVDDFKDALNTIFSQKGLGKKACFYIHAPSRTDKTAAPEGGDTISVVIPVSHLGSNNALKWTEICNMAREGVINRLKKSGVENLEDNIKFEIKILPETWENIVNVTKGATFGSLNHKIMQMGYFRPHNRHSKYKNLYFAGGSTHPGNGIPLVLLSGKLTSERIIHDFPSNG